MLSAVILMALACGEEANVVSTDELRGDENPPSADEPPPTDLIDVNAGDFQSGDAPESIGAAELPAIVRLTGPVAVTNGGVALLQVELAAPVSNPSFVVERVGASGFHNVVGTEAAGEAVYEISVQVAAEASLAVLVLRVALTDAAGNIGDYAEIALELVQSGTGDVKITLSFDRAHDLDLHVIEPNGEEVSYLNDASATGGRLDLDSGANCEPGGAMSENIFWPPGGAPAGEYRVTVHNFEQCAPGPITFSVLIAHDSVVNTYSGSFADGTEGTVADVATFRR